MKRIDVKGKKNTPKMRLQIYKAALEYYKINNKLGFCNAIFSVIKNVNQTSFKFDPYALHNKTTLQDYPELLRYKPDIFSNKGYWFNIFYEGIEQRIKILEIIIKDMENKE
jgi:hypothetical protein